MARYRHAFPPFMVDFFEEMVNRPDREAPATEAWEREVRSVADVKHHTNTIDVPFVDVTDARNAFVPACCLQDFGSKITITAGRCWTFLALGVYIRR
jgi:hypothetical protein